MEAFPHPLRQRAADLSAAARTAEAVNQFNRPGLIGRPPPTARNRGSGGTPRPGFAGAPPRGPAAPQQNRRARPPSGGRKAQGGIGNSPPPPATLTEVDTAPRRRSG